MKVSEQVTKHILEARWTKTSNHSVLCWAMNDRKDQEELWLNQDLNKGFVEIQHLIQDLQVLVDAIVDNGHFKTRIRYFYLSVKGSASETSRRS